MEELLGSGGVINVFMRSDKGFLDEMRQVGDEVADNLVSGIFARGNEKVLYSWLAQPPESIQRQSGDRELKTFLLEYDVFPDWMDHQKFVAGQRFFKRYALDIMTLLGAMSLPYCYAASPGNKAIYATEKMRKKPGKRLLDTAQFIISAMKEDGYSHSGHSFFEIRKTRIIHALVRYSIRMRGVWDAAWGVPVNQEDMAGTNIAFSYIPVVGLEKSGYRLAGEEKESFLYTWKVVGSMLGIHADLLPETMPEASALEEAIRVRHFKPSQEGAALTRDLIDHYKTSLPSVAALLVESQIRYLVGPQISSYLELKPDSLKDKMIGGLNRLRESVNRRFVNPYSYEMMLRNHEQLRRRYS